MDLSTGEPQRPAGAPGRPPDGLPTPPPPPPPMVAPPPVEAPRLARPPRAGQLTTGWRAVTAVVWALAFVALIAVWKTSRELGLNTWWLGPLGEPQPWFVTMIPFVPPVAMLLLTYNNSRWLPWFGLGAASWLAVVAVFDLARVPRLALVELAIAAAGGLIAVAGLAGRYRR